MNWANIAESDPLRLKSGFLLLLIASLAWGSVVFFNRDAAIDLWPDLFVLLSILFFGSYGGYVTRETRPAVATLWAS